MESNSFVVKYLDSEPKDERRLMDIVDDEWRLEKLPLDDIKVPAQELPDPEADNGNTDSLRQQEMKWTDMALGSMLGNNQTNQ